MCDIEGTSWLAQVEGLWGELEIGRRGRQSNGSDNEARQWGHGRTFGVWKLAGCRRASPQVLLGSTLGRMGSWCGSEWMCVACMNTVVQRLNASDTWPWQSFSPVRPRVNAKPSSGVRMAKPSSTPNVNVCAEITNHSYLPLFPLQWPPTEITWGSGAYYKPTSSIHTYKINVRFPRGQQQPTDASFSVQVSVCLSFLPFLITRDRSQGPKGSLHYTTEESGSWAISHSLGTAQT